LFFSAIGSLLPGDAGVFKGAGAESLPSLSHIGGNGRLRIAPCRNLRALAGSRKNRHGTAKNIRRERSRRHKYRISF
jgi:hypothetical protein